MMLNDELYIKKFENASYEELIQERDSLIRYIRRFEKLEKAGDHTGEEWMIDPTPDVIYQMYLTYLSELCSLMQERYNEEYINGDRKL